MRKYLHQSRTRITCWRKHFASAWACPWTSPWWFGSEIHDERDDRRHVVIDVVPQLWSSFGMSLPAPNRQHSPLDYEEIANSHDFPWDWRIGWTSCWRMRHPFPHWCLYSRNECEWFPSFGIQKPCHLSRSCCTSARGRESLPADIWASPARQVLGHTKYDYWKLLVLSIHPRTNGLSTYHIINMIISSNLLIQRPVEFL